MPRLHFAVTGRVQGVAFRAHACDAARQFGIVGFISNRADGAVEGEAEGDDDGLAEFFAWLNQGSPWSRVENVETEPLKELGTEQSFEVRR